MLNDYTPQSPFRRIIALLLIALLVPLFTPTTSAQAAVTIVYVDADAPLDVNDGSSWAQAYTTLQDALTQAEPTTEAPVEIWVAAGTYYPDEGGGQADNDRSATFTLKNNVAIYGGFAGTETQLSERDWETNRVTLSGDLIGNDLPNVATNGDNAHHVVTGSGTDATAILDGVTVIGGNANGAGTWGYGGGMYTNAGSPTLTNVTFSVNVGLDGGGMHNDNGSAPTLTDVTFTNNTAAGGGGGMFNTNSNPTLINIAFIDNTAHNGGGMYNTNSNPTLTNGSFSTNRTRFADSGGMYNTTSNPTLTNGSFITNSTRTADGGGMFNTNSNPTLNNVIFVRNNVDFFGGAGMANENGSSPTLTNVTFIENRAGSGSGMHNTANSNPTLTNVAFIDNFAEDIGGGMWNVESSPTLNNVTFTGNFATDGGGMSSHSSNPRLNDVSFNANIGNTGGGMLNLSNSNPILTNVTFSANIAQSDSGGGMFNSSSNPILTNVTFSANIAVREGGGMLNSEGSSPTLTNVTFSANASIVAGSGMLNRNDSRPTLHNVIIAGSMRGEDCINQSGSSLNAASSNNLIQDADQACDLVDGANGNLVGVDPLLGPLADNGGATQMYALLPDSPAINAGSNAACAETDQRGISRPQGAVCDIGAYELVDTVAPTIMAITRIDPNPVTSRGQSRFLITFSEPVRGVDIADLQLKPISSQSDVQITELMGNGAVYTVTVVPESGDGFLRLDVPDTATITDPVGNPLEGLPFTQGEVYLIDRAAPTVRIRQADMQSDPADETPILFNVEFSTPVFGFEAADIILGGDAPGRLSATVSGSGKTYTVSVSGMTGNGVVRIIIPAGIAWNLAGRVNLDATNIDNEVTYHAGGPPFDLYLPLFRNALSLPRSSAIPE